MSAPSARPSLRPFRPRLEPLEERAVPALSVTDLSGGLTATDLANNLAGTGVAISNVSYAGTNASAGLFTGGSGIIGFPAGIILSSGQAADVVGPNDSDSTSTSLGTPGDPQLDAIVSPDPTFDATILEFDFVPAGSTLTFTYVFSSEEYNEFVDTGLNDVFAFFLNGTNVALIPGTSTAVSIDTVNLNTNSQFYVNNAEASDPDPAPPPLRDTQMDGLTVALEVTAQVTPGVANHIKLAVADTGDRAYDSNVFIAAGSFSAPLFKAYRPLRYAFRSLEQNLGQDGPVPEGGTASEPTYDGLVTIVNAGTGAGEGPLRLYFRDLPPGVQVVNRDGVDATTGRPFINVPADVIELNVPVRVPVKLSNPLNQPLGTYYLGRYFLDVDQL